jgi:hypothetical protein
MTRVQQHEAAIASVRAVVATVPGAAAFVEFLPQQPQGGPMSAPAYRDPAKLCGSCRFFKPWGSNDRVGTCQNATARKDGYSVGRRDGCSDHAPGVWPVPASQGAAE